MTILLKAKPALKKLMAEQGATSGELAEKVGVSRMTFHNILSGKTVSTVVAKKLCDAFKVNMWDYFEMEE